MRAAASKRATARWSSIPSSMTNVTIALVDSTGNCALRLWRARQKVRADHFPESGAVKVSYEEWQDELLRFWPDAQIAHGYPVVLARAMGMIVGEWSNSWTFWVKTPHYKSACLDAQTWDQTIGGVAKTRPCALRPPKGC